VWFRYTTIRTETPTYPEPSALLEPESAGAIGALSRALELHDPVAARRGVLRALVIDHLAGALELDIETQTVAFAGALLSDVGVLLSRTRPPGDDAAMVQLGATLLERVAPLSAVARAIRHSTERWDGGGTPHGLSEQAIPLPSRLIALARALVGPVDLDITPTWPARCGRARALSGTVLDPSLVAPAIAAILESPPSGPLFSTERGLAVLDSLIAPGPGRAPIDALRDVGAAIHAAQRLDEVLVLIADYARRALDASTVSIGRRDLSTQTMQVLVNVGELPDDRERFPADETYALSAYPDITGFAEGREHALMRLGNDPATLRYLDRRGINSEIAAPIVIDDVPWGMVWASTRPARLPLTAAALDTLRVVAIQAAIGVAHTERLAGLETLALRDPLTGLGNRRVLDEKLRSIFRRGPLERQDCALIMCDVDELKIVNDTLGHAVGDRVLLETANALRSAVAGLDAVTICRIGGDEFCVVLERGGLLHAQAVADRVAQIVSRAEHTRSVSCGIAIASPAIETPSQLLRAADVAQYEQKRARKGASRGDFESAGQRRRARRDLIS
jgi:diguanylate cyclase (GGDEF)-like protein